MSNLSNIIQRRELEPLLLKALKVIKHYERAANCKASVVGPNGDSCTSGFNPLCNQCAKKNCCSQIHKNAVKEAKELGSAYIYVCPEGYTFWTSPFYAGERFAGALLSGGIQESEKDSDKVKALVQMSLVCADQISGMSFTQKNIPEQLTETKTQPGQDTETEFETNPIEMERRIMASLRRGDNIEAKNLLSDLLDMQFLNTKGKMQIFKLKAMELAVLLSRTAMDSMDINDTSILDINSNYLTKIEESQEPKEIKEILFNITDKMAGKIFSFHGVCHFSALRKAERYIWTNYTRKISLQEIAAVSGLSASYFSTIFKEEMGENLSNYINRLRVEKAATMLLTTNMPISGIAAACGFEDQSWFSKIFKSNTGFTPGSYREQGSPLGQ